MIVECITTPWRDVVGRDVTVGNHYKVVETNYDDDEYLLIDDTGYQWWYCTSHFKEIEDSNMEDRVGRLLVAEFKKNNVNFDQSYREDYVDDTFTDVLKSVMGVVNKLKTK